MVYVVGLDLVWGGLRLALALMVMLRHARDILPAQTQDRGQGQDEREFRRESRVVTGGGLKGCA